jgi:hypothetical protein
MHHKDTAIANTCTSNTAKLNFIKQTLLDIKHRPINHPDKKNQQRNFRVKQQYRSILYPIATEYTLLSRPSNFLKNRYLSL